MTLKSIKAEEVEGIFFVKCRCEEILKETHRGLYLHFPSTGSPKSGNSAKNL